MLERAQAGRAPSITSYPLRKQTAVVVGFDDLHPGRSTQGYDGGGDLDSGVLGRLRQLLDAHPAVTAVLFCVADWRETAAYPTRTWLARLPGLREVCYQADVWPEGTFALDSHRAFCEYVRRLPRTEIALHGLYHVGRGSQVPQEFARLSEAEANRRIGRAEGILAAADIPYARGFCPPGWATPPALLRALDSRGYQYIACSRDLTTEVAPGAVASAHGLRGLSLFAPARIPGTDLVHIPSNWSATCSYERAFQIVDSGGVLSIKGHLVCEAHGHVSRDGLSAEYADYLDGLFSRLARTYRDALWWPTMLQLARWYRTSLVDPSHVRNSAALAS